MSNDRIGIGFAAALVGVVAAHYLSPSGSVADIAIIGAITALLGVPVALADLGEHTYAWTRNRAHTARAKSYLSGAAVGWASLAWIGLVLVGIEGGWWWIALVAPAVLFAIAIFGYLTIGRRLLRRRLLHEEFRDR